MTLARQKNIVPVIRLSAAATPISSFVTSCRPIQVQVALNSVLESEDFVTRVLRLMVVEIPPCFGRTMEVILIHFYFLSLELGKLGILPN